jgi:Icc-related predicted phosphoesterase
MDSIGATRVANPGPVAAGHYALVEIGESVSVTLD